MFLTSGSNGPDPNPEKFNAGEIDNLEPAKFEINPKSLLRFPFNTIASINGKTIKNGYYYLDLYAYDYNPFTISRGGK